MRQLDTGLDPAIVAQIDDRLDGIIRAENVSIPWAIESGSRAWGFPSPDSDYDCRFVYVRSHDSYLGLFPRRDVIETPLTDVLDVNGWDVGKAIKLMLKGNAVIVEWLTSELVYRGHDGFRTEFLELAAQIVDRGRIGKHYLHLAYSMRNRVLEGDAVKLKKLFYVLRPVIALRWLRQRPKDSVAPMNFLTLCAQSDLPADTAREIAVMIETKAITRELGEGEVPPALRKLIEDEILEAEKGLGAVLSPTDGQIALANAFFRRCIDIHG
jgi:uncharacterized protein